MATLSKRMFLGFTLLAFSTPVWAAAVAGEPRPAIPWLKQVTEEARDLAVRKVAAGSPEEKKWQTEVKATIDRVLDWDELTKRSLGTEWEKLTDKQKEEFSALLREMVEASYMSKLKLQAKGQLKKPSEVKIDWQPETKTDAGTTAVANVTADQSKSTLTFQLHWLGDRWKIYDVAVDDVSTLRTYRSQFRKLISDKGFNGLLERMRTKTKEIRAGLSDL